MFCQVYHVMHATHRNILYSTYRSMMAFLFEIVSNDIHTYFKNCAVFTL